MAPRYGGTCQACRQHNPKATAQCCVPFPTEAELEQVFTQDETKMKMQEHTIKAGAHFELKIETNMYVYICFCTDPGNMFYCTVFTY